MRRDYHCCCYRHHHHHHHHCGCCGAPAVAPGFVAAAASVCIDRPVSRRACVRLRGAAAVELTTTCHSPVDLRSGGALCLPQLLHLFHCCAMCLSHLLHLFRCCAMCLSHLLHLCRSGSACFLPPCTPHDKTNKPQGSMREYVPRNTGLTGRLARVEQQRRTGQARPATPTSSASHRCADMRARPSLERVAPASPGAAVTFA